jgi:hypothetical protein
MGSPEDPTPVQVDALNHATALPPPMEDRLRGGRITLTLTPDALDLIRIAQK